LKKNQLLEQKGDFTILEEVPTTSLYCLIFNLRHPIIGGEDNYMFYNEKDKENYTIAVGVRKAICYAINREEINRIYNDNEFLIADSPISPNMGFLYCTNVMKYKYNLTLAMDWLKISPTPPLANGSQNRFIIGISVFAASVAILIISLIAFLRKRKT